MTRDEKFLEARRIYTSLKSVGTEHLDLLNTVTTFSHLDALLERLADEVIQLRLSRKDIP